MVECMVLACGFSIRPPRRRWHEAGIYHHCIGGRRSSTSLPVLSLLMRLSSLQNFVQPLILFEVNSNREAMHLSNYMYALALPNLVLPELPTYHVCLAAAPLHLGLAIYSCLNFIAHSGRLPVQPLRLGRVAPKEIFLLV